MSRRTLPGLITAWYDVRSKVGPSRQEAVQHLSVPAGDGEGDALVTLAQRGSAHAAPVGSLISPLRPLGAAGGAFILSRCLLLASPLSLPSLPISTVFLFNRLIFSSRFLHGVQRGQRRS